MSYRQAKRLLRRHRAERAKGSQHRRAGGASNHARPAAERARVLALVGAKYSGAVGVRFGPTLAAEHLASEDGVTVHHDTLRQWWLAAGLWSRARKRAPHRQRRERKAHFGELVQIDGSFHLWYKSRAPRGCLMNLVDDATGRTLARLGDEETIWAAADALRRWIEAYGVPLALYTDWKTSMCGRRMRRSNHGGRTPDAIWPDVRLVGDSDHRRELAASQGPGRTESRDRTGSPGEEPAARSIADPTAASILLESLLEEAHIKVSALVSDLLGASARRMLRAIGTGKTNPVALAALGSPRLHATPEQLADALGAAADMPPIYRRLLAMTLAELDLLESHMQQLDEELAALLRVHQAAMHRLAGVPGFGVDSAQQIIAEVGATATTFPTAKHLASWVGACPGHHESAGVNRSHRVPNGNRQMRRLLNQCAHAAVRTKGSIFELLYRRFVGRLGHAQAIGAVAQRLCRLVWKILHDGVTYEERGPIVSQARPQRRAAKILRELRSLGYRVELIPSPSANTL